MTRGICGNERADQEVMRDVILLNAEKGGNILTGDVTLLVLVEMTKKNPLNVKWG